MLLFTMVARFAPFHCPTEPATNPVPVTVIASPVTFAARLAGDSEAIAGTGLATAGDTVKVAAFEVPPICGGFLTVTCATEAVAMSALEMAAVNFVLLTNAVARSLSFQRMVDPATNFEPSIVNVRGALPALLLDGLSVAMTGVTATILNDTVAEVPPVVGASTVTWAKPARDRKDPSTVAVNWELLTNVVGSRVEPHRTLEPVTKFVPFTVRRNVLPPASALEGESEVRVGAELLPGGSFELEPPSDPQPPSSAAPNASAKRMDLPVHFNFAMSTAPF